MKIRFPGGVMIPLWWLVIAVPAGLFFGAWMAIWLGPGRLAWFMALLVLMQLACLYELWRRRG